MKGLLLKDYYMAAKYCKMFLLVMIFFLGFSFFGDDNAFFIFYPILLIGILPVTLLSYDAHNKWEGYSIAFPYTRAQMVSAKYLIGLIGILSCWLLTAIVQLVRMLQTGEAAWEGYFSLIGTLLALGLLIPGVMLPLVFKFGAEKGRIVFYVMIAVICAVGAALSINNGWENISLPGGSWGMLMFVAGCMLLFVLSWRLSIFFYRKREL